MAATQRNSWARVGREKGLDTVRREKEGAARFNCWLAPRAAGTPIDRHPAPVSWMDREPSAYRPRRRRIGDRRRGARRQPTSAATLHLAAGVSPRAPIG